MLLALSLAAAEVPSLSLICTGRALTSIPVETNSVVAHDSYGGTAYGGGVRSQLAETETTVGFRMMNGEATIRIPSQFLPELRGGKAGWFKVKNLVVSDTEITGNAALNVFNSPSFRIDRMTGELSTSGGHSFSCQPETATARKF